MRHLNAYFQRGAVALFLVWAESVWASGATWKLFDFGEFSLRAPAAMVLTGNGIDSLAGSLTDNKFRIGYDFGLNADPLQTVQGDDFQIRPTTVGGLPANLVTYSTAGEAGQLQFCAGIHVPEVRHSTMGRIRLTMLACGARSDSAQCAQAIFDSLRFRRDTAR